MFRTQNTDRTGRRGQAATLIALMAPALMGSAAFGVDYGLVTVAQIQVQAVADAAALAATSTMDDDAQGMIIARAYAERMSINGVSVDIDGVEYGYWSADSRMFVVGGDEESNAVRVRASAEVPMHLARIFDIETADVSAEAGAGPKVVPQRAPDTVVVLDTTRSMNAAEIRSEREALDALAECVYERSSPDSRVSVVLFGGIDTKVIDMTEYGTEWSTIRDAVDEVQSCEYGNQPWNRCSNTNPASGYEAALEILANAETPPEVGQAVVLMSDGAPTTYNDICSPQFMGWYNAGHILFPLEERCEDAEYTYRDRRGRVRTGHSIRSWHLDNWALQARDRADGAGVDVYTTFYGPNTYSGNRGSQWLADHVTTGDGSHHRALTRDEIADTFVDICVEFTGGSAGMLF